MDENIKRVVAVELAKKNSHVPAEVMRMVEKGILLQVLDQLWKDHIATLDHMRHTIVLRAYGQKDPLNEYKKEAFNLFSNMLDQLREKTTFILCRTQIQTDSAETLASREVRHRNVREIHERPQSLVGNEAPEPEKNIPATQ